MPRSVLLPAVALAGVIVSVAMVLVGLPEANASQSVLLELSSLPLSVSVAIGILMLRQRAARPLAQGSRLVLLVGMAVALLGVLLIGWAYLVGPRPVVQTGQLLVWLGLLAALIVMVRVQPRNRSSYFHLEEEDEAAHPEQRPSL